MPKCRLLLRILFYSGYFVLFIVALTSCAEDANPPAPLSEYYFPLEEMHNDKVYRFRSLNDTALADQLWYFRSTHLEGAHQLQGAILRVDGLVTHRWTELQTSTGMVMTSYSMASAGSNSSNTQLINTSIVYDDIFPFRADPNGIFLFDMKWKEPDDPESKYELIRNRIFSGDTMLTVMGKKIKAIHFRLKERVEVDKEGILGLDLSGDEYYAEGLGLVLYVKNLSEKNRVVYELDTIMEAKEYLKTLKIKDPFHRK